MPKARVIKLVDNESCAWLLARELGARGGAVLACGTRAEVRKKDVCGQQEGDREYWEYWMKSSAC